MAVGTQQQMSAPPRRLVRRAQRSSLAALGEPLVWLSGGALALCLCMIAGLLGLVLVQGALNFWPAPLVAIETREGRKLLGEINRVETYTPQAAGGMGADGANISGEKAGTNGTEEMPSASAGTGAAGQVGTARAGVPSQQVERRLMLRTGNFELAGTHFQWIAEREIARRGRPEWAVVVERMEWGRFYGTPAAFVEDGRKTATAPAAVWSAFQQRHRAVREQAGRVARIIKHEIGAENAKIEQARLRRKRALLKYGAGSAQLRVAEADYAATEAAAAAEIGRRREEIAAIEAESQKYGLLFETADGREKLIRLDEIVRAYPANRLGAGGKLGVYLDRWREYLTANPREANSEGGVFPAIWGTVAMTLIMVLFVAPFGVMSALYLREYARAGIMVSAVRIAVNNLAGVPSIVFGVFGLGFFCYLIGGGIDQLLFSATLPDPTYGTGGILWASLTLALLTLPVVIVATEEALAAVPNSLREGSYGCGASKWQTIHRIVLPRALPGIMTGLILAMARGAGEVAPLMLVGVVKKAQELPLDGVFPYLHPERSFMHLGFHIYDLGFQSQNSEAAKPLVFTTTLLLVAIIACMNLLAIGLRSRLSRHFRSAQF